MKANQLPTKLKQSIQLAITDDKELAKLIRQAISITRNRHTTN